MIRKFVENGFTFNINRIAEGVAVNVSATTQLLADIAKDKEIPNILLTRMADILSYHLDEAKFEKRWNLDFSSTWRTPEEALENGRKELTQLKASTAAFLRKIEKYQTLPDDVIQAIEKLDSSETENPGIKKALQEALTYLKDISETTIQEFQGMVNTEVTPEELKSTRELLIKTIKETLMDEEKHFLIGFKKLTPDWSLLGLERVEMLPGVQWKILNLKKMSPQKRNLQCKLLEEKLFK